MCNFCFAQLKQNVNLSVCPPHAPKPLFCRSTLALRRGRAFLLAPPTTAAKKCQSLPAHCAKTSSSSPSTKFLSISMTQLIYCKSHLLRNLFCKIQNRHLLQDTEHVSPLTCICIQTVSVFFRSRCLNFKSSMALE